MTNNAKLHYDTRSLRKMIYCIFYEMIITYNYYIQLNYTQL